LRGIIMSINPYRITNKPFTRWWWFSNQIIKEDIDYQLKFLKDYNFGGVEIAFLYTLPNKKLGVELFSQELKDLLNILKNNVTS